MAFTLITDDGVYEETYGHTGGPDYNMGKEYSRTFTWKNDEDETYRTAEATFFVHARYKESNEDLQVSDLEDLDEDTEVLYFVEELTETVVHEDPEDPWTWGNQDMEYGEGSMFNYDSLEKAEQEAKRMAQRESAEFYSPEYF